MSGLDVELRGVARVLGGRRVVDGVDLEVRRGEFFSLLGPSGCGKTTILRMIAGFESPDAGTLRLAGADIAGVPPHRRDVNLVFQNYALFPHLSVGENVAFGLRMKGASDIAARVAAVLAQVRLPGTERRSVATLSGGEQQRIALARAIVNNPRVLLLDEPLAALDLKLRVGLREELRRLQRELGMTFVFVTHDQEEALSMSDRVAVMNAGRVEQVGAPREIYGRPATRFVAEFVGAANLFDGLGDGSRVRTEDGWEFAVAATGPVTVVVRPEHLRLSDAGVEAVVEEILYQGPSTRLVLRAGARRILCDDGARAALGDRVHLAWGADAARVIAR